MHAHPPRGALEPRVDLGAPRGFRLKARRPAAGRAAYRAHGRARPRARTEGTAGTDLGRAPARVSPLAELLDHLPVESGNVVGVPAGDGPLIDEDLGVDPFRAGILEIRLQ